MEGERYAPTTFLSRRPARRQPAHWHPRGGGHADGYLSPPAGTVPAPATCGKLHILRAVRRPPTREGARLHGRSRIVTGAAAPDTRRHKVRCCAGPALTSCAALPPDTRGRERERP